MQRIHSNVNLCKLQATTIDVHSDVSTSVDDMTFHQASKHYDDDELADIEMIHEEEEVKESQNAYMLILQT